PPSFNRAPTASSISSSSWMPTGLGVGPMVDADSPPAFCPSNAEVASARIDVGPPRHDAARRRTASALGVLSRALAPPSSLAKSLRRMWKNVGDDLHRRRY